MLKKQARVITLTLHLQLCPAENEKVFEQLVRQILQLQRLGVGERGEALAALGVSAALGQKAEITDQTGHRGADIVRNRGDQLAVGLPGALFVAHTLDHGAAHIVHFHGENRDLVSALGGDDGVQIPFADDDGLFRQKNDPVRDPADIEEHHRNEDNRGQHQRADEENVLLVGLGIVADRDLVFTVGKAHRIELAVDTGDLDQVADLIVDRRLFSAADAVLPVPARDNDGHVLPVRRPACDGGGVCPGKIVPAHEDVKIRVDLRLAGRDRVAAHVDLVDKIIADPVGQKEHPHGKGQSKQSGEEHLRIQACACKRPLNQSDIPFPRRCG